VNKPITDLKPEAEISAPHVLQAISAVMEEMSREGIRKDRKNTQQNYSFRGIDDVYNALAPVLAKHALVVTPRCLDRQKEVVATAKGGTLFYVTVDMEFELASAIDGSTKVARMFGEAMDSGDKATNKAMSAAYKYMAMQEFCIPTEGDNDADATTHKLATAEEMAINLLKGCGSKELFADAWTKNKDGWKRVMDHDAYARVVAEMKRLAAQFAEPQPPATPPKADDGFGLGDDEIPETFR
jgi:hypothetical protein